MYFWKIFLKVFLKKYWGKGFQKSSNSPFYYTKINIFLHHENTENRQRIYVTNNTVKD